MIAEQISHYCIGKLGVAWIGEVWLAEDTRRRKVMLKRLPEEFTRHAERVRRLELEAHAHRGAQPPEHHHYFRESRSQA